MFLKTFTVRDFASICFLKNLEGQSPYSKNLLKKHRATVRLCKYFEYILIHMTLALQAK